MANGHGGKRPGAGRPKGARDKLNVALRKQMDEMNADPARVLAEIMLNSEDEKIQRAAAADLMPYLYPRLSTQDINLAAEFMPDVTLRLVMPDDDSADD